MLKGICVLNLLCEFTNYGFPNGSLCDEWTYIVRINSVYFAFYKLARDRKRGNVM
jgi:hypothetical protein